MTEGNRIGDTGHNMDRRLMNRIGSWMLIVVFFCFIFSPFQLNAEKTESWWETILRVAGISATPSSQKGPGDKIENGELWIVNVDGGNRFQIVEGRGFRSPIFRQDQSSVLALKEDEIVEIKVSGLIETPIPLFSVSGITKLVGGVKDDSDTILVLQTDDAVGLLSLETGQVTPLPYDAKSSEARRMINHLRGWSREYGNSRLYVERQTDVGLGGFTTEWTDVIFKEGQKSPENLSHCQGTNCRQPSLSPDGTLVVYVKESQL